MEQGAEVVISTDDISSSIGRIEEFKTAFSREFAHKTDAEECRMCIQFRVLDLNATCCNVPILLISGNQRDHKRDRGHSDIHRQ